MRQKKMVVGVSTGPQSVLQESDQMAVTSVRSISLISANAIAGACSVITVCPPLYAAGHQVFSLGLRREPGLGSEPRP